MIRNLLLLALTSCVVACNKPGKTVPIPSADSGALINNRSYAVQVDFYASKEDRINQANKVYSCTVPSKGRCVFPLSKINPATVYWYDIYTSDYTYSNWPWGANGTALNGYGNTATFDLGNYTLTQGRYYFLRGNNEKTTWKAVDRQFDNTSDWQSLTDTDRFMLLEVYRDEKVTVNYFPTWFIPVLYTHDTLIAETVSQPGDYTVLPLTHGSGYSYLYSTASKPKYNVVPHNCVDTLTLDYKGREWIMVRQ